MDSLTQFVLGAGVGAAALGRMIGPRKAAVGGGLLGTVPDLDVLFPFDDPIDSFTLHRSISHSFIVQALATPIFGEVLLRLFATLRDHRWRTYIAVFLIFATHAVLDAMTIYGTQLFWPLSREPVGIGSVFIIDPFYTLPLLVVTLWAFFQGNWSSRFGRGLTAALVISTAYLAWSLLAQQIAKDRAVRMLAEANIQADRLLAIPAPFSTLLWRIIAIEGDRYLNLYVPIPSGSEAVSAYAHPRGLDRMACLEGLPAAEQLARFSKGYYRIDEVDGTIRFSDLRMGLTPSYAFTFVVAKTDENGLAPVAPSRHEEDRFNQVDVDWLIASVRGELVPRPAEAHALVSLKGAQPIDTEPKDTQIASRNGVETRC